jgi:hypothetical protein
MSSAAGSIKPAEKASAETVGSAKHQREDIAGGVIVRRAP